MPDSCETFLGMREQSLKKKQKPGAECTPLIPGLRGQRQVYLCEFMAYLLCMEFQFSQGYIVRSFSNQTKPNQTNQTNVSEHLGPEDFYRQGLLSLLLLVLVQEILGVA